MTRITGSAPVLLVRDVIASAEYFGERLGFSYDGLWGDPPDFCIVRRDDCTIMLSEVPPDAPITPNWRVVHNMWNIYIWVDDVEAVYRELQRRGATIDYELGIKLYGVKEFGVQDLDGHDIAFGEILAR